MSEIVRTESGQLSVTEKEMKQEIQAMKNTIMPNASDSDLSLFAKYCAKTQLDPFSRQIYAIQRGGRWGFQTSIDGFRVVAQRSGTYEGQTPCYWCGPDGIWKEVWLSSKPPAAAKLGVYRKGHREPVWAVARFDSYNQPKNPIWRKMPDLMIAKCCEALALRKAFPNDLSGIYTSDEMDQVPSEPKAQNQNNKPIETVTVKTLTEGQIKRFWALANEAEVSHEKIKAFLKTKNIESTKNLSTQDYNAMCEKFALMKQQKIEETKQEQQPEKETFVKEETFYEGIQKPTKKVVHKGARDASFSMPLQPLNDEHEQSFVEQKPPGEPPESFTTQDIPWNEE